MTEATTADIQLDATPPEQVIADVQAMLDKIREQSPQALRPSHLCLSLRVLRGPLKFRNRKAKKAWAQWLQRAFVPPVGTGARRSPLGQWWRFLNGGPLPNHPEENLPWAPHKYVAETERGDTVSLLDLRRGGCDV